MEVESSSPLAAMQSNAFRHPSWSLGNDSPSRSSLAKGGSLFGPKLKVAKPRSKKHDSGTHSSPTSVLAADLSQNFHIDKTPVPAPRRSLFSSALGAGSRSMVTTPSINSSPGNVFMDVSPLPHKAPFAAYQSPLTPTAGALGRNHIRLCSSPPMLFPDSCLLDPPRRPKLAERKKVSSRTSMLRQNSRLSAINPALKSQAPIFNRSTTAPQIKLEELFGGASPEQMKPGSSSLALPPPKLFIGNEDGSPIAPLNRQPRLNPHRPKGKVRRTHSMFEKPKEVMRDDDLRKSLVKMPINPSPRADPGESSYLPCFTVKDDPLRRINKATLCEVMDGTYENHYDEYLIVDCRFEYEYEGGHIEGAINVNSIDTLEDKFFSEPREKRHLIIFHCEYSAHRAPRMALHLRKRDRQLNMHRYPALHYPNIYILEGGYSSFFNQHRLRCDPQHYVEMGDEKHKRTCEREMSKFRKNTKFTRTQSFTYGTHLPEGHDSSPSAGVGKRLGCGRDNEGGTSIFPARQGRMTTF